MLSLGNSIRVLSRPFPLTLQRLCSQFYLTNLAYTFPYPSDLSWRSRISVWNPIKLAQILLNLHVVKFVNG